MAENRRWRLLGAVAEHFAQEGPTGLSSAAVARRAGVSKTAFYEEFDNVGDCLLAATRAAASLVGEALAEACGEGADAGGGLEMALAELRRLQAEEPDVLALLSAPAAAADPAVAEVREQLLQRLAGLLGGGRPARPAVAAAFLLSGERADGGRGQPGDLQAQLVRLLRWTSR